MARRTLRRRALALTLSVTLGLFTGACGDSGGSGSGGSDTVGGADIDAAGGGGDASGDDAATGGDDAATGGGDDAATGGGGGGGGGDDAATGGGGDAAGSDSTGDGADTAGDDAGGGLDDTGGGLDDTGGGLDDSTSGDSTAGGEDGDLGTGDAGPNDEDAVDPPYSGPSSQCVGVSDVAAISAASETLGAASAACVVQCAAAGDVSACGAQCMQTATGVSDPCADCFGVATLCIVAECAAPCAGGDEEACDACYDTSCRADFDACSGLSAGVPQDQCLDASDATLLIQDGDAVLADALACAEGCASDAATSDAVGLDCIASCVGDGSGLSEGCSVCAALLMGCVADSCDTQCAGGDASICDACVVASCSDLAVECMGLDVFAESPGADLCLGTADSNVIKDTEDFAGVVAGCLDGCAGGSDVAECVAQCTSAATGLGAGCASCYGTFSECLAVNCDAECNGDAANEGICGSCTDTYCDVAFGLCAGTFTTKGACANPADADTLEGTDIDSALGTCQALCDGADDLGACVSECFAGATGASAGCSACHGQLLVCSVVICPDTCLGQDDAACGECIQAGCLDDYLACAGFDEAGTGESDLCLNEADLGAFEAGALDDAETCVIACDDTSGGFGSCVENCIEAQGVSTDCAGCFGAVFGCSAEACSQECFGPAASEDGCSQCQEVACGDSFQTCSGLDAITGPISNQCSGESDQAAVTSGAADAAVEACTVACVGQLDVALCMEGCLATDATLTEGCAGCYVELAICNGETCGQTCQDSPGAACTACLETECAPGFGACTGVALATGPGVDQCLGVVDVTTLQDPDTVNDLAASCAFQCSGESNFVECTALCVEAGSGLTGGCAECYGEFFGCLIGDCGSACSGETPDECNTCLFASCSPNFVKCTGDLTAVGSGACVNEADAEVQASGAAETAVPQCSESCIFDSAPAQCALECITGATGLSDGCAGCYVDSFLCVAETCFNECGGGGGTPECDACIESQCAGAFLACAGFAGG